MTKNKKSNKKTKQKCFNFKEQKKKGSRGESLFMEYYKEEMPRNSPIRDFDIMIRDNEKIELKTDFTTSLNFFIERYSDTEKKKPGSIWQNGDVDYFIYFFINELVFYWFEPTMLRKYIEKNIDKYETRRAYNPGYYSTGILIKREELEKLCVRKDTF